MSQESVFELRLKGYLDEEEVLKLKVSMSSHIAEHAGKHVRIDVSELKNVSGTILSLLLCCMRVAEQHSCSLEMTGFSQKLYDMARVGGLETLFPIANG